MYLPAEFGGHKSYGNGAINSYMNSYMNTSAKAKLTASLRHIERFSKSGKPIYNSEVLETAGRKKRPQTAANRYVSLANTTFNS